MAGFTIPNSADALVAGQASPDAADVEIALLGLQLTGVASGLAVTPSSGLTLSVAAGVLLVNGKATSLSADTVTLAAADATLDRYDLVYATTSGFDKVTGTAAANPVFGSVPASAAILAAVYVPATDTSIASNQIVDKRVLIRQADEFLAFIYM